MPPSVEHPHGLRPFIFHGVTLNYDPKLSSGQGYQAVGDCPLCGREGKFFVDCSTGKWDCKRCGASGNPVTFLRQYWEACHSVREEGNDYQTLASNRKLLSPSSLEAWGVVKSILTGEWLVPAYGPEGNINNLYRYALVDKRWALLPTATLGHYLHGMPLFDPKKPCVYVCEGIWDAIALWEVVQLTDYRDKFNVVAVPSCSAIPVPCLRMFAGKHVTILFDNDHPLKNPRTGKSSPPAAWTGMQRLSAALYAQERVPASLSILSWGKIDTGYDPALKHGYDVRDALTANKEETFRIESFAKLVEQIVPVPEDWIRKKGEVKSSDKKLRPLACGDYKTLVAAWGECMRWYDGLDRALANMLATVTSTLAMGDQLWLKVVGPPSTGKTTLCEALSVAEEHVLARSIIRGMHSGMKFSGDGAEEEDASLVVAAKGKTLVIKDADTLLQAPNLLQILSELRDLYDTTARTQYRNRVSHVYEGHRMTVILCGTSSIRKMDASDLGERFIDSVIMEEIDPDLEDEILFHVAQRANRNMAFEANGRAEGRHDPQLTRAMQLTGGYVEYLRNNAQRLLSSISISEKALRQCMRLAQFVAYLRARPSSKQDEAAEREFAARLTSQFVRLAKCLAAVLNVSHVLSLGETGINASRPGASVEVMRRVRQVAIDTAKGKTFDLVRHMAPINIQGIMPSNAASVLSMKEDKGKEFLLYLRRIGAMEAYYPPLAGNRASNIARWRLTSRLLDLYNFVIVDLGTLVSVPRSDGV